MRKFDLVVCDWAGTTVDYGSFAPVQALVEAFKEYGINPADEEVREPMGLLKIDHIKAMLDMERIQAEWKKIHEEEPDQKDVEKIYESFNEKILIQLGKEEFAQPKPHVVETITSLKEQGYKIAGTTGYTAEMMEKVAPKAKELGYEPDCYFTPDHVGGKGRPYPYMIFESMKELEVEDVKKVVKIGDTVTDVKEGKNAGVMSCAVLEGSSEMGLTQSEYENLSADEQNKLKKKLTEKFTGAGADKVFANFKEFYTYLVN